MQSLARGIREEVILPDILSQRRAVDDVGMEKQPYGIRLIVGRRLEMHHLTGCERCNCALLIVVWHPSVGYVAALGLLQPQRIYIISHCTLHTGTLLFGLCHVDHGHQRVSGLEAHKPVIIINRVYYYQILLVHSLRLSELRI